jgi:hypothetical protein
MTGPESKRRSGRLRRRPGDVIDPLEICVEVLRADRHGVAADVVIGIDDVARLFALRDEACCGDTRGVVAYSGLMNGSTACCAGAQLDLEDVGD